MDQASQVCKKILVQQPFNGIDVHLQLMRQNEKSSFLEFLDNILRVKRALIERGI